MTEKNLRPLRPALRQSGVRLWRWFRKSREESPDREVRAGREEGEARQVLPEEVPVPGPEALEPVPSPAERLFSNKH
ncbi:hypothetical protein C8P63_10816 [Melghirimyces profundicolus]|uniref:Uncharacterized protein n=1 Tax=Melghirimyces profundicolus TaxID=1242148 RepID=A0A2T6BXL3_9BACL|nr:hypothetical protein [Melghirimyces profundicolus]PTX60707.1 hypothetical protein C8P63_10816 [Melghirimyces profundicolus]